jgi:hypothetical protein
MHCTQGDDSRSSPSRRRTAGDLRKTLDFLKKNIFGMRLVYPGGS